MGDGFMHYIRVLFLLSLTSLTSCTTQTFTIEDAEDAGFVRDHPIFFPIVKAINGANGHVLGPDGTSYEVEVYIYDSDIPEELLKQYVRPGEADYFHGYKIVGNMALLCDTQEICDMTAKNLQ
jgi:hypothetical protein